MGLRAVASYMDGHDMVWVEIVARLGFTTSLGSQHNEIIINGYRLDDLSFAHIYTHSLAMEF